MMCLVDRRLVGSVSPGTRVTAVGILSIFQGKDGGELVCVCGGACLAAQAAVGACSCCGLGVGAVAWGLVGVCAAAWGWWDGAGGRNRAARTLAGGGGRKRPASASPPLPAASAPLTAPCRLPAPRPRLWAGFAGGNQRDKAGAVAIRQPYLRVIGFQEDVLNGDTARRPTFS